MTKVTLLDHSAADLHVVNAARVSFATKVEEISDRDKGLIRFLMKNRHGTPFEHGSFRFHVEAPIFVFRDWHRHRTGHSYNEQSSRYTKFEDKWYRPEHLRRQEGKPGQYKYEEDPALDKFKNLMEYAQRQSFIIYDYLCQEGVAKEQAKAVLPVGMYSQMYWTCNPRSLMHFLGLRNAPEAIKEIRDCAVQAEEEFAKIMPITHQAFVDNNRVAP